ncbi:hypothetical protein HMPREF1535_04093 [Parabacteroides goldsteinii DSM 19448 = WAL 12034]|uniref:Glycosyl transferase family A n=5 Tax=Parabacteroides goldsteinii TaxID=328812 RepID=A0A0J6C5S7_9BACT|nr:hypothetical protein HMPREF1535_04093 [Parabacteroides goldsteinii DSM 19448 = WAL 12034]KMM31661.1 glycosyl transferase family A [Parabacteroides goldsteinii]
MIRIYKSGSKYNMNPMSNSMVSIIIPVYNTEEFVEEAVRSIMNQTLQDIEIIIINDGSTDNSLSIIRKLANEDDRIQVYSRGNQGPSATRNQGISIAKGKYLYFMDSDDYLEPEALESCFFKCEENALDFIFFDADILNKETNFNIHLNYQRKDCTSPDTLYTGSQLFTILVEKNKYSPSPCLNLINTKFLKEINLLFLPGIIHEDQLFSTLLYLQANRVMCIHKNFFKRRFRSDSIMTRKFSLKNIDSYFIITDRLFTYASEHTETRYIVDKHLSKMLNAAVWLSYKMPFKDRLYIARRCIKDYKRYVSGKNILILLFKSFLKK